MYGVPAPVASTDASEDPAPYGVYRPIRCKNPSIRLYRESGRIWGVAFIGDPRARCARASTAEPCEPRALRRISTIPKPRARRAVAFIGACLNEREACAMLLLRAGARSDVKDDWGDTPLSIAQKKEMKQVIAIMEA